MKVALIHYWLITMRGGEKVLEALCELYPDADIFTHVYDPSTMSAEIRKHKVNTTFINRLPKAKTMYQSYLPLMPMALEQLDLRDYDLVISSESGPAKGVITRPGALHICYCHTPMRYVWDMYHDYRSTAGLIKKLLMPPLIHYLRMWDLASAYRVDNFIANSEFVANRIRKHYRRDAEVIHPPVDVEYFNISEKIEDYYIMFGQLTRYKRADIAVQAFNKTGKQLIIIGDGEQKEKLERLAKPNISFVGWIPDSIKKEYFRKCKALIFPGIEDFGIVPVEVMASGRPVIAFAEGGAMETVKHRETGVLFNEQTPESLNLAIDWLEKHIGTFDPEKIADHARSFAKERFKKQFTSFTNSLLNPDTLHKRRAA